jgi:hypothetical protein
MHSKQKGFIWLPSMVSHAAPSEFSSISYPSTVMLSSRRQKKMGIKLVGPMDAFLIQGEDRVGAVADVLIKLGQAKINVTTMQAVATGAERYGAILWVKPRYVGKASQLLGVRITTDYCCSFRLDWSFPIHCKKHRVQPFSSG